mmetsp:Transcript_29415/g.94394  ORF Transcript_29415/g.94394 Transcript_29415/m.94394 type:complete len:247 (-) Transcript_29415:1973-2713(-)
MSLFSAFSWFLKPDASSCSLLCSASDTECFNVDLSDSTSFSSSSVCLRTVPSSFLASSHSSWALSQSCLGTFSRTDTLSASSSLRTAVSSSTCFFFSASSSSHCALSLSHLTVAFSCSDRKLSCSSLSIILDILSTELFNFCLVCSRDPCRVAISSSFTSTWFTLTVKVLRTSVSCLDNSSTSDLSTSVRLLLTMAFSFSCRALLCTSNSLALLSEAACCWVMVLLREDISFSCSLILSFNVLSSA